LVIVHKFKRPNNLLCVANRYNEKVSTKPYFSCRK